MLGEMKYASLYPSPIALDGGAMFGIIPKPMWSKRIIPDEFNRIKMTMRVYLIQTKNKLIIIDTGAGDYQGEKFNHRYGLRHPPESFAHLLKTYLGADPHDVTDVVLTHLHFDHASGALSSEKLQLSFPEATLHVHRDHYLYSQKPSLRDGGSFQTNVIKTLIHQYEQKKQLHWLSGLSGDIITDVPKPIKFFTCHGHTPFQILPYNEDFIYLADLVPTHAHVDIPWVMGYDLHPGESARERAELYPLLLEKKYRCVFDHDLHFSHGNLVKSTSAHGVHYSFENLQKVTHEFFEWH